MHEPLVNMSKICCWTDYKEYGIKECFKSTIVDIGGCKVPTDKMFGSLTPELSEVLTTPSG